MPKIKTNSGAKKRFALTGTGKIKRKHAYKSHILTKKTKKAKKKPHSHDYAEDGRCEQCKSIAGLEIMLDGFPKNFLTQKSSFKIY